MPPVSLIEDLNFLVRLKLGCLWGTCVKTSGHANDSLRGMHVLVGNILVEHSAALIPERLETESRARIKTNEPDALNSMRTLFLRISMPHHI